MEQCWILGTNQGTEGFCFHLSLSNSGSAYVCGWDESFLLPPQRWAGFFSLILTEALDFCLVLEAEGFLPSPSGLRLWLCKRSLWGRSQGFVFAFWWQLVTTCMSMWWRGALSNLLLCLWLSCEHPVHVCSKELEGECKLPCVWGSKLFQTDVLATLGL